jgi:hypothetical protein
MRHRIFSNPRIHCHMGHARHSPMIKRILIHINNVMSHSNARWQGNASYNFNKNDGNCHAYEKQELENLRYHATLCIIYNITPLFPFYIPRYIEYIKRTVCRVWQIPCFVLVHLLWSTLDRLYRNTLSII